MPDAVRFFARFHPLAVHLPIGLFIAVAAAEVAALVSEGWRERVDPVVEVALAALVLTGVAAFVLGDLLARGGGYPSALVARHRALTLAAVLGACASLVVWHFRGARGVATRIAYRAALATSLLMLVGGAHFGGSLTHGEAYLTRFAPEFLRPLLGASRATPAPSPSATTQPAPAAEPLVFQDVVLPILKERCVECHGPDKTKGGLKLDSFTAMAAGGEDGPALRPGDGAHSPLVDRMLRPVSDDERMPPEGKPGPSPAQIDVIRFWVNRGGSESLRVRDALPPDGARAVLALAASPSVGVAPSASSGAIIVPPASGSPAGSVPTTASSMTVSGSGDPAPPASAVSSTGASGVPGGAPSPVAGVSTAATDDRPLYKSVIAPVFANRCVGCHGPAKQKGGLRLDSLAAARTGGENGPAIVPGNTAKSLLVVRIALPADDDDHMPPSGKPQLTRAQIDLVTWWIAHGASERVTVGALPAKLGASVPRAR
jgi:mono/diheme cytochrome c family protein